VKQSTFSLLALAASTSLVACAKHNEVEVLHHEAVVTAKYYAPRLDPLDARVQAIFKRGSTIPASTPGIDAVGQRLSEARDMIIQMRSLVAPGPDGKSSVEKQADAAAKDNRIPDLQKLQHDTKETLDRGLTIINDDLATVESWIAYYDRQALALPITGERQPPEVAPPVPPAAAPEQQPAGATGSAAPH
jgi:hypothetical protein